MSLNTGPYIIHVPDPKTPGKFIHFPMPTHNWLVRCEWCGCRYDEDATNYKCPNCGGPRQDAD